MSDYLIDPERYASIVLSEGAHDDPSEGTCLMEAVSYLVGEQHTDQPKCVSLVLGAFGRRLNDGLPDDLRQELRVLIPSLPGTAGDGLDGVRADMAMRWLDEVWEPAWKRFSAAGSFPTIAVERAVRVGASQVCAALQAAGMSIGGILFRISEVVPVAQGWIGGNPDGWEEFNATVRELQVSLIDLFAEMIKNPR